MKRSRIHPADIQAGLKKAGIRQKDLAHSLNVSESAISACIKGGQGSRIREHLSGLLHFDPRDAWPQYYASKIEGFQARKEVAKKAKGGIKKKK